MLQISHHWSFSKKIYLWHKNAVHLEEAGIHKKKEICVSLSAQLKICESWEVTDSSLSAGTGASWEEQDYNFVHPHCAALDNNFFVLIQTI